MEAYLLARVSQPMHDGLESWLRREECEAARQYRAALAELSQELRVAGSPEERLAIAAKIEALKG
jgi:hypothetical protein